MVGIIYMPLLVWTPWNNGVDLTNLRRLYYLPMDCYEALLGEESTHPDNAA